MKTLLIWLFYVGLVASVAITLGYRPSHSAPETVLHESSNGPPSP